MGKGTALVRFFEGLVCCTVLSKNIWTLGVPTWALAVTSIDNCMGHWHCILVVFDLDLYKPDRKSVV